jgi:hypothetical protein
MLGGRASIPFSGFAPTLIDRDPGRRLNMSSSPSLIGPNVSPPPRRSPAIRLTPLLQNPQNLCTVTQETCHVHAHGTSTCLDQRYEYCAPRVPVRTVAVLTGGGDGGSPEHAYD